MMIRKWSVVFVIVGILFISLTLIHMRNQTTEVYQQVTCDSWNSFWSSKSNAPFMTQLSEKLSLYEVEYGFINFEMDVGKGESKVGKIVVSNIDSKDIVDNVEIYIVGRELIPIEVLRRVNSSHPLVHTIPLCSELGKITLIEACDEQRIGSRDPPYNVFLYYVVYVQEWTYIVKVHVPGIYTREVRDVCSESILSILY